MPIASLDDVPYDTAIRYAGRDADGTLRIAGIMQQKSRDMGLEGVEMIDLAAIPMIERMQRNGLKVDPEYLRKFGEKMTVKQEDSLIALITCLPPAIQKRIDYTLNPNSGDQCAPVLFEPPPIGLGLKPGDKTGSGKRYSTDDKTLEAIRFEHAAPGHIMDYREFGKMRDSFVNTIIYNLDDRNRIRGTVRVTRVSSGRLSMSNPNLLALPVRGALGKEYRRGYIAEDGCVLGGWDLDQAEMRWMAHESGDPVMVNILRDPNSDIHTQTACWLFGVTPTTCTKIQRYAAKRCGFGVITGITGMGLNKQMKLNNITCYSDADCDGMIVDWFKIYAGVKGYMADCRTEARRYGYVRDAWGRIKYLPGIHSDKEWEVAAAERESHSHKIQAGAQGIIKISMAEIWDWMKQCWRIEPKKRFEPLLQVHDSLLFEVQDSEGYKKDVSANIERMMTNFQFRVPMRVKGGYGPTWGDLD